MQVCLSLYDVLLPPIKKGLVMFMATFSALQETIKNKIKRLVANYRLT